MLNPLGFTIEIGGFLEPHHGHAENRGLGLGAAALGLLSFLGGVLVRLPAAKVHFVTFDNTMEAVVGIILCKERAHFMQDEPSSFLRNVNIGGKLHGRNAFLVARNEVHGKEPLHKGNLRVLENSAYSDGEIALAVRTAITAVLAFYAVVSTAVGAYNITVSPTAVTDGAAATFLAVEVGGKFEDAIEMYKENRQGYQMLHQ